MSDEQAAQQTAQKSATPQRCNRREAPRFQDVEVSLIFVLLAGLLVHHSLYIPLFR